MAHERTGATVQRERESLRVAGRQRPAELSDLGTMGQLFASGAEELLRDMTTASQAAKPPPHIAQGRHIRGDERGRAEMASSFGQSARRARLTLLIDE